MKFFFLSFSLSLSLYLSKIMENLVETQSVSIKAFLGILFAGIGIIVPMTVLLFVLCCFATLNKRISALEEKEAARERFAKRK